MKRRAIGRREFLIGAGGIGAAAVAGAYLVRQESQRSVELTPLPALLETQPPDVLIVGSGPAGAILGSELAAAGIRSAIIDSGPGVNPSSESGKLDAYETTGSIDYPIRAGKIRALGGTSLVWTGRSSRYHPIDFEPNAYTPKGTRWPFTYSEIEPFYDRAERSLRVRGGPLSEYHAPRSKDLPYPYSRGIPDLRSLLAEVDVVVDRSPSSQASIFERSALRVGRDILPDYSVSRYGSVTAGAVASAVIDGGNGEVAGVQIRDYMGNQALLEAGQVILACGAIENTRILMLSQAKGQLQISGKSAVLLGQCFMEHPHLNFRGVLDEVHNSHYQLGRSMQFYDEFKGRGLGSVDVAFYLNEDSPHLGMGVRIEMIPTPDNTLTLTNRHVDLFGDPGIELSFRYSKEDIATMRAARDLVRDIYGRLGARKYEEIEQGWGHHHMGTCRMGDDPAASVVDGNLRMHGTKNLYVLGSSSFVTGGSAHPTLLIAALAHRLADHLAAKIESGNSDTRGEAAGAIT